MVSNSIFGKFIHSILFEYPSVFLDFTSRFTEKIGEKSSYVVLAKRNRHVKMHQNILFFKKKKQILLSKEDFSGF